MTKSLIVSPAAVRAKGTLTFPTIPVNAYDRSFATELKHFGAE